MLEKDDYEIQKARVKRIVEEIAPGKAVRFDANTPEIRFAVWDDVAGVRLTESSGHWLPTQLADKSDKWLRDFIRNLSGGKI